MLSSEYQALCPLTLRSEGRLPSQLETGRSVTPFLASICPATAWKTKARPPPHSRSNIFPCRRFLLFFLPFHLPFWGRRFLPSPPLPRPAAGSQVVRWLLFHRGEGGTAAAFETAATNGHVHVLEWLMTHTALRPELRGGSPLWPSALARAAANGHLGVIRRVNRCRYYSSSA